ncbi:MAG: AAA domain-containing protein [Phormidesmis sp.]
MSQSNILQFCYLLEAQLLLNLDNVLENQVSGRLLKKESQQPLPWAAHEDASEQLDLLPEQSAFSSYQYQVYFAPFSTAEIFGFWQKQLSLADEIFPSLVSEDDHLSCYGSFRISEDGNLIEDSLELSGAPLLLGKVQATSPQKVAQFWNFSSDLSDYNHSVQIFFKSQAKQVQESGKAVTAKTLRDIANHIVNGYGHWRPNSFGELGYWVRLGHDEKPQQRMFGSFFIKDIERIGRSIAQGEEVGRALATYLSPSVPKRIDLNQRVNQQAILSPACLPLGRWPTNPDHHLSLQQQCAVNLIASKLSEAGLFSVNGPPGTGKTTMLRDVVAHVVVQRAIQMAAFDNPNSAFIEPKTIGGKVSPTSPYRLAPSITGYEVVVASSNNGAVENISKELPSGTTVADEYQADAAYFPDCARSVLREDAWGLLAAALGKKENCLNFAKAFWNQSGTSATSSKENGSQPMGFPSVLDRPIELDWNEQRRTFGELKRRVSSLIAQRRDYENAVKEYRAARRQWQIAQEHLSAAQQQLSRLQEDQRYFRGRLESIQGQVLQQKTALQAALAQKPSIGLRILSFFKEQSKVTAYRAQVEQAQAALNRSRSQEAEAISRLDESERDMNQAEGEIDQLVHVMDGARRHFLAIEAECEEGRRCLGAAFADESWWSRSESAIQMDVPWIDRELDDARSLLLLAALRIHQSFIEQSADRIRKNLQLWVELLQTGFIPSRNKSHAQTLWQSIFLVVPVVSTTFASISRLFRHLDREALGWLLIDEAGQAVPQSAIGAMWRAKRVVVVGDPLQLEPVFTFQSAVVEGLRHHFQLLDCWNPHSYSVQGLADRVNPFGTELEQLGEPLWVGCPLRVHRRCIEPMFSISNAIAYGGKMVLATRASENGYFPLGPSQWIHSNGICEGKHWVAEHGEEVLYLLAQMVANSAEMPEVFVITPFKEVSNELKKLLRKRPWASEHLSQSAVNEWLRKSIGTVHTFQGKEADTVIFVLGLDRSKTFAAGWASQKANLLNVAVTRARYRLYVIGDKALWGECQYFGTALASLSRKNELAV